MILQIFRDPLINMVYNIFFFIFIPSAIILLIVKKIRDIGKVRALVLWKKGTQSIKKYHVKNGELQVRPKTPIRKSNVWCPKVDSENILPPEKKVGEYVKPFGFKQQDLIIAVEDAPACVTLKGMNLTDINKIPQHIQSVLLKHYTKDEVKDFLSKAVAQASIKRKMFDDSQFYIFMIILALNLFVSFMIANRMGIF